MEICLGLIHHHAQHLDGVKISLLDAQREIDMRQRLPPGVRMYTGDDFNYDTLIRGDGRHHSGALLGVFDAIAPAASAALQALEAGRPTNSIEFSHPPFRCPGTFSKRPRIFTKRESCSSLG